ncbi:MAG: sodium:solute symporter family transporter, partial [Planctomycetota bacterium]
MDPTILSVVAVYFVITLGLGFWVARNERNVADDYFLAGRKLPWYAVSMSMTGSNIGTEHFMGMVGTAYAFGLAPATFEWGNFIPYSVLIWIFLPFFFRKRLYTIPEFLERRYNHSTRSVFACLTLIHMVLVVLVPALYAGGRILYEMGLGTTITEFNWGFMGCILIISAVTAAYCIYGGLLSVVWTDVLQVAILL